MRPLQNVNEFICKAGLILCFLLLFFAGFACTIIPDSFCKTLQAFPEHTVISGIIVGVDTTGIDVEILEVLRGTESRQVIRIWDGTDFDCNGPWSMAASDIGNLQDTILIILPLIESVENEWDVIGDYRRPDPYHWTSALDVAQDSVFGFISGLAFAPPEYNVFKLDYANLTNSIEADGDCTSIILSTHPSDYSREFNVKNPFDTNIEIRFLLNMFHGNVHIFDMTGIELIAKGITGQDVIELESSHLPSGLYVLQLNFGRKTEVLKLVKQ